MRSVPGYRIERASDETLLQLPEVERVASERFPAEDIAPEARAEGLPLAVFERARDEGRLWTAVRDDENVAVGFALATWVDGAPHLYEMDVLPEHGRRGLGAALVGCVADWGRAQGASRLTLTTFRHLPWNAPFYARLGFRELPIAERGAELAALLAEEVAAGLDPAKRVAMMLRLEGDRAATQD